MAQQPVPFWGFRPPRELLRARLGTLERQVIEIVWAGDDVTVRDVHAQLDGKVAYTTVMTTLDRLFRKGLLARTKRAARVRLLRAGQPGGTERHRRERRRVWPARGEWSAPLPFLSNLVDAVGERDRALLDELERLVKVKRRQLGRDATEPRPATPREAGEAVNEVLFALLLALAWFGAVNLALSAVAAGIGSADSAPRDQLRAGVEGGGVLLLLKLAAGPRRHLLHLRRVPAGSLAVRARRRRGIARLHALRPRRRSAPSRSRWPGGARSGRPASRADWSGAGTSAPAARGHSPAAGCPSIACRTTRPSSRSPVCCGRASSSRAPSSRRSRATKWT